MKIYLIFVFTTVLIMSSGFRQPVAAQTKLADYTFGGNDIETCAGGFATADGGFLTGGSTRSTISGEVSLSSPASAIPVNFDFWIVKTNAQGVKQWDKRFGGAADDRLVKIMLAADGGYLLCGWSTSGVGFDKSEASRGGTDYWVVKVNALGIKQWDKRFGTSGEEYLMSAVASPDGGCLLAGFSSGQIAPDGDRTQSLLGMSDVWVVKVDATGNKEWDKRLGGNGSEYVYDVANAPAGGFVLGAWASPPSFGVAPGGDVTGNGNGQADYWIVKIDALGTKVWDKLYGGLYTDIVSAVLATPDGGTLVAGSSSSPISGDKSVDVADKECWLLKLDAQGNKQWDQVYGTSLSDKRTTLALDPRGGYFLGASTGYLDPVVNSPQDVPDDYWVANIDANGVQRWDGMFGGSNSESLVNIIPLANNSLVLVGSSNSNNGRDKTSNSRGDYDIWLVQIGVAVLGAKTQNVALNNTVSIFPNPTNQGFIMVEATGLREQKSIRVEIINTIGQAIQILDLPVYQSVIHQQVDLTSVPTGIYALRLHTSAGIITKQLVKN